MKTTPLRLFILLLITGFAAPLFGETLFFAKERRYVQTGPTTVVPRTDGQPFRFGASVEGNATSATVTPPSGNPQTLSRADDRDRELNFKQEFATQAALDAAFPNGSYTVTINGRSASLALNGDLYPAAPVATLSQGTFANGQLTIDRTQPLTVTISFSQNYAPGLSHLGINVIGGNGPSFVDIGVENDLTQSTLSFTVPANRLTPGVTYTLELQGNRAVSLDTTSIPGYTVIPVYSDFTIIRIGTTGGSVTPAAPTITSQPRGATVNAGSTVALTVAATGSPAPAYQWRKDGTAIAGATSDTLVLSNIAAGNAGNYTVVVSNSSGSATSVPAAIAVVVNQPSRLPNLSVRTNLATSQTLIVGLSVTGSKNMLVRAVGPTLASFGVSGALSDPAIELYNSTTIKIDENNDWSAGLGVLFTEVGAFGLVAGSKDAALQRSVSGSNTAHVRGPGSGVVLVEVYDAGGTGKLTNVSARNAVGTGENILIAGFVVDGTAAKTLLIRGVGAKLADFGVSRVLLDPKLEIYTGAGVKIAENDNWNSLLQPIARGVGAFDLTIGSADAALVLTLSPGAYTAQISGISGTTGEALVEVYEIP